MIGIIGGSFAGLFAARALALKGWKVTVFESDAAGDPHDPDRAFDGWQRPGVPQLRQPHTIRALARRILLDRDPQLAADLLNCGAIQWPYSLRKPDVERVEDPDLIGILARRTTFEPVIRARVEKTPGVTFAREYINNIVLQDDGQGTKVTGVQLRDGTTLPFQCVIDASGRRTRLAEWLQKVDIQPAAIRSQPAGMIYYSRYFRFLPGAEAANATGIRSGPAGVMPLMAFRSNRLDRDTFSLALAVASWQSRFRALKSDQVFNAFARSIPSVAAWIDPKVSTPISKARAFGDIFNTYWDFLREGKPIVRNLYSLGDSRVHTSPYFGWGITLALKQAQLLADTFTGPDNIEAQI
ncbi:tryptophan 7-halogenase, partial [Rhizobium sp. Leaf386]|uniref:FAD-dependent oxidoreductase n=1 Tax=Rhizobium sp. Leaf386 TaxID=1736359 RepID=UPI0007127248